LDCPREGLPVIRHRLRSLEELGREVLRSIKRDPQFSGLGNSSSSLPSDASGTMVVFWKVNRLLPSSLPGDAITADPALGEAEIVPSAGDSIEASGMSGSQTNESGSFSIAVGRC
jgi:hypothetical protein